jgi:hypothetical protein
MKIVIISLLYYRRKYKSSTPINLGEDFENTVSGFIDYPLPDEGGFPIAVSEAK